LRATRRFGKGGASKKRRRGGSQDKKGKKKRNNGRDHCRLQWGGKLMVVEEGDTERGGSLLTLTLRDRLVRV